MQTWHTNYLSSLHQPKTPCGTPGLEASLHLPRHVGVSLDPSSHQVFWNKGVNPAWSLPGEASSRLRCTHTVTDTHTQSSQTATGTSNTATAPRAGGLLLLLLPRLWAGAVEEPALQEQSGAEIAEWFGLDRTIKISWFQPSCHGQGHLEQDCSPLTGSQWRGCRRESLKASTLDLLYLGCQVSQNCHGKTSGVPCWAAPEVSAPCARYRQPCALKGKRK